MEATNKRNYAMDNKSKLFNQITKQQVNAYSGLNNMDKEFNLNKKFMGKIKADMLNNWMVEFFH